MMQQQISQNVVMVEGKLVKDLFGNIKINLW